MNAQEMNDRIGKLRERMITEGKPIPDNYTLQQIVESGEDEPAVEGVFTQEGQAEINPEE